MSKVYQVEVEDQTGMYVGFFICNNRVLGEFTITGVDGVTQDLQYGYRDTPGRRAGTLKTHPCLVGRQDTFDYFFPGGHFVHFENGEGFYVGEIIDVQEGGKEFVAFRNREAAKKIPTWRSIECIKDESPETLVDLLVANVQVNNPSKARKNNSHL